MFHNDRSFTVTITVILVELNFITVVTGLQYQYHPDVTCVLEPGRKVLCTTVAPAID